MLWRSFAAISPAAADIDQPSDEAIIERQGFPNGIGRFKRSSAKAASFNHVIDSETNVISGTLNTDGQVFAFPDRILG
jgi:hypothetical protein